jgi:AAA domain
MTKLSELEKQQIISLIEQKKINLGSYDAVANYCGISAATVTQLRKNKYQAEGDDMWLDVGLKLGFKQKTEGNSSWVTVPTNDYKLLRTVAIDAKNKSLFIPISDVAGMGKTACLKAISEELAEHNTFYIRCWDWGKKEFLFNLCKCLGIDAGRGFKTPNDLLVLVIDSFKSKAIHKPLLIIDEADKLKASALRFLIPLYNECEDMLGCLIAGTENLEKEIKRGVRYQAKGYDEIDSRFGRRYIKLLGCIINEVKKDKCEVRNICRANGLENENVISNIIEECKPVRKLIKVDGREQSIRVITDLRRLKRLVQKEQLKSIANN